MNETKLTQQELQIASALSYQISYSFTPKGIFDITEENKQTIRNELTSYFEVSDAVVCEAWVLAVERACNDESILSQALLGSCDDAYYEAIDLIFAKAAEHIRSLF